MTKKRLLVYATYVTECAAQATLYGKCVSQIAEKIKKDDCAKEFKEFRACIEKL